MPRLGSFDAASTRNERYTKLSKRTFEIDMRCLLHASLNMTEAYIQNKQTLNEFTPAEQKIKYCKESVILPRRIAWAWKWDTGHPPIPRIGRFRSVRSLLEASIRSSSVSSGLWWETEDLVELNKVRTKEAKVITITKDQ